MRILYIHQHFSTPKGSTGTRSYHFAKELIRRGHSVKMVCGSYDVANTGLTNNFKNGSRYGIVDGISITEINLKYGNSLNFLKRTLVFIKFALKGVKFALKGDYDIIFSTSTPLTASIPGIFGKLFKNRPFVFEVRDLWPELPKAMGVIKNPFVLLLMDILESISYKISTACVGLSPGIVEGIKKKVPDKKIIMIPNGCDTYSYDNSRNKINDKLIAVFPGSHGYANGLDEVLNACKALLKMGKSNIQVHLIGEGVMKKHLVKRVANENIHNCIFLNPMPKEKLFSYICNNVHLGLMVLDNIPAFYNGTSPNKFFDYISLGLPVINNYPGWLAKLIKKNNCGLIVSPNDSMAFAKAMVKLDENRELLKTFSNNSKILAKEFDRNLLANQFADFLESCT